MNESKLNSLNLSSDEIRRLGNAFADNTFKDLFSQYIRDISDPDNKKKLEDEIIQLERERGNDIILVRPTPGYVLKTSADGNNKAYINICSSDNINKLNYSPVKRHDGNGLNVFIPHSLSPFQKIRDKRNRVVFVYTVVFHSETLKQSAANAELKNLVEETALSIVEKSFKVTLDKLNCKVSKKSCIGTLELTVIRKKVVAEENGDKYNASDAESNDDTYVEPKHRIKYRNEVDLQNSTMDRYCKMDILIPKQMIIEIDLPLLKSIQNTTLNVQPTAVTLTSENPKYKLNISLPYEVDENSGSATFDSDIRVMKLELQVKKRITKPNKLIDEISESELHQEKTRGEGTFNSENGLDFSDSDFGLVTASKSRTDLRVEPVSSNLQFLNADIKYKLPSHFCNYYEDKLAFTMNLKNVDFGSFDYRFLENKRGFWVKFMSLGTGHFPMYYSMCVVFQQNVVNAIQSLKYSIESETVFVYVYLQKDFVPLEYYVGTDIGSLKKEYLNEPDALYLELKNKRDETLEVDLGVSKFSNEEVIIDVVVRKVASQPTDEVFPPTNGFVGHESMQNGNQNDVHPTNGIHEQSDISETSDKHGQIIETKMQTPEKRANDFVQAVNFNKFCEDFRTQFSFDDELHCMSESELLNTPSTRKKNRKEASSSWIVETKNARKAKRKKKARDKKLATNPEENEHETAFARNEKYDDEDDNPCSKLIDIRSAYKFSDLTARSILKNKNRSFSESSGDELCHIECSRSLSIDDFNFSSDSYSHSGPKKTVRFNDVISKKLYSSEISILEQRKRTKRRCQRKERKISDSDNSETEIGCSAQIKRDNIRIYNELLLSENSEIELTSLSESGGETSDDQSDNPDTDNKSRAVPCSKKNHKRRGKKSARKNASTAKHHIHGDY